MSNNLEPTLVRFAPGTYVAMDREAAKRGISRAALIRRAVDMMVSTPVEHAINIALDRALMTALICLSAERNLPLYRAIGDLMQIEGVRVWGTDLTLLPTPGEYDALEAAADERGLSFHDLVLLVLRQGVRHNKIRPVEFN